jgi:hypothetical protein
MEISFARAKNAIFLEMSTFLITGHLPSEVPYHSRRCLSGVPGLRLFLEMRLPRNTLSAQPAIYPQNYPLPNGQISIVMSESSQSPGSTAGCRPNTPTQSSTPSFRFPILKPPKHAVNRFLGVRRAFLHAHGRKAELSQKVQEDAWRLQEKQREWAYQQQLDLLTRNIQLRDDEYLRRQNKLHPKPGEYFARPTTGLRDATPLPQEHQCSLYPRNHFLYLGS